MILAKPDIYMIDRIHGLLLDWSAWLRDGRATPGLYPTSQWPTGKPGPNVKPVAVKKRKHQFDIPNPHETRATATSRPLMAKTMPELERIHAAIIELTEQQQRVIALLYLYRLPYQAACDALAMTSKQVSQSKYKAIQAIVSRLE